jgi:hypothetical protein
MLDRLIPGWYLAAATLLHSRRLREKYMSDNDKKAKKTKAFHVRFRPDQAEWLHENLGPHHRNVPEKIRKIVDKEMIKQELNREKRKR